MELYEIIRTDIIDRSDFYYTGNDYVITATMDKDLAERMLTIYESNQRDNEAYKIRTLRSPEAVSLNNNTNVCEHCEMCNSYNRCLLTILERPNEMIRCIHFGKLKENKTRRMNYENKYE